MKLSFKFVDLFATKHLLITCCLVLLPLTIYWQVYNFPFLWDDDNGAGVGHIYNPFILNQTIDNLWQLFKEPYFGMYIPISYTVWGSIKFIADFLHLPANSVFHLANVLVHIVNGLLLFVLIRQFISNRWAVLIGTLFFLLHPIQVESVTWVSEFRGLLAAFFALLSLYWYMKSQELLDIGKVIWMYFVAMLFLLLALLSKPSAAMLPVFILTINHFHYQYNFKDNIARTFLFALLALVIIVVSYIIQSRYSLNFTKYIVPIWQRPIVWLDSVVFYLVKIIYPYNLGASYGLPPIFIVKQWWFYPLALPPFAVAVLLLFARHKYPLLVMASVLFIAGFFTTSGLVSFAFQKYAIVADRYLYLAFVGLALLLAIVASNNKKYIWVILTMILLMFTLLSAFRQIPIWQNLMKLMSHSRNFEVLPKYASGHFYNLALVDAINGKDDEALAEFAEVLRHETLDPNRRSDYIDRLFYNIGAILVKQKKYQLAIANFTESIKIDPTKPEVHNAKIHTHLQLKQCAQAKLGIKTSQKLAIKVDKIILAEEKRICLQ